MSFSSSLIKSDDILVLDASVVINLNATGHALEIISAIPARWTAVANILVELERGLANGHNDGHNLKSWADDGIVSLMGLSQEGTETYESLLSGDAKHTLDDGEAATIAHARDVVGAAVIDERKARALCASMFPMLRVLSTVDLLLDQTVAEALGTERQIHAMLNALQRARMRVPTNQRDRVVELIGKANAALCPSLPASLRQITAI